MLVAGLAGLAVVAAAISAPRWLLERPVGRPVDEQANWLRVARGESFARVAARIEQSGWAAPAWLLRFEARRRGVDRTVAPGWYEHRDNETVSALIDRLGRGEIAVTRVTIPEGWRLDRILRVLADSTRCDHDSLRALTNDPCWLAQHGIVTKTAEGYVFPETYLIARGEQPRAVLDQIVAPGEQFFRDSLATRAAEVGLDRNEVWTLASIIEAEAARPEERRLIAAVFWNRLELGMRLESDPTVLHALGRPPGRVLYADLEVDSPYNTYRRTGLPPGPICAPGADALRAAVSPEPRFDALFFVARGDGSHVFSRTFSEHGRARAAIRAGQIGAARREPSVRRTG